VPQPAEHVGQEPFDAGPDARRLRLAVAGDVQHADLVRDDPRDDAQAGSAQLATCLDRRAGPGRVRRAEPERGIAVEDRPYPWTSL
jgi:hypothetical protein